MRWGIINTLKGLGVLHSFSVNQRRVTQSYFKGTKETPLVRPSDCCVPSGITEVEKERKRWSLSLVRVKFI